RRRYRAGPARARRGARATRADSKIRSPSGAALYLGGGSVPSTSAGAGAGAGAAASGFGPGTSAWAAAGTEPVLSETRIVSSMALESAPPGAHFSVLVSLPWAIASE